MTRYEKMYIETLKLRDKQHDLAEYERKNPRKDTDNVNSNGTGNASPNPLYVPMSQETSNASPNPSYAPTSQGTGNAQVSQPQGSFWSDIGNGLRQIAVPVKDFVQGVGAGALESVSYGVSRDLEVYYDRDNEIIYLVGKVVGNTATGIVSGIGTVGSGAATVATSPTGVGAVAFGAATVYCGSVTVSAAGNAVANVMQIVNNASGSGGSNFKDKLQDIQNNPQNWKVTNKSVIDSTKKGNTGGKSIETEYTNKNTGEKIYEHTLQDSKGKLIEQPHFRPYPKQIK